MLMALYEIKKPVTAGQISEFIALRSKGRLYKVSATIKDSLDNRLKREFSRRSWYDKSVG